jgi:hypothetical protein
LGIRGAVARNTLANANATRDWRIYASFAVRLIGIARGLHAEEPFGLDLAETVYALDVTTIDLCLSVFPWAPFRSAKAALKLHTLLDLRAFFVTRCKSNGPPIAACEASRVIKSPGTHHRRDGSFPDANSLQD